MWYLRHHSLWDAGSHVIYIYLALWFINSFPSMRITKNTVEAEHHIQHLARKGVCELSKNLSTQQLSAVTSCTSGMIQGFRLPRYANYSLTQHLSDPPILYIDSTIQQVFKWVFISVFKLCEKSHHFFSFFFLVWILQCGVDQWSWRGGEQRWAWRRIPPATQWPL